MNCHMRRQEVRVCGERALSAAAARRVRLVVRHDLREAPAQRERDAGSVPESDSCVTPAPADVTAGAVRET